MDIEKVRKKLSGLKQQATNAMAELTREKEIRQIEVELQTLEREQVRGNEEALKSRRNDALALATEADDDEKSLLEKLAVVRRRKFELLATFEKNVPTRRVQTSSQEFVHLTREVEFLVETGFAPEESTLLGEKFANRIFEKRRKTEHAVVEAIPNKIERYKRDGWRIVSGESIKEEPLTSDNSMEIGTAIPDAFYPRELEEV